MDEKSGAAHVPGEGSVGKSERTRAERFITFGAAYAEDCCGCAGTSLTELCCAWCEARLVIYAADFAALPPGVPNRALCPRCLLIFTSARGYGLGPLEHLVREVALQHVRRN